MIGEGGLVAVTRRTASSNISRSEGYSSGSMSVGTPAG